MKLKRIFHRLLFYPLSRLNNVTEFISSKLYMNNVTNLLKGFGMNIDGLPLYIHKSAKFDDFDKIYLGNNVVISFGCYFLTHDYSRLVSYNLLKMGG